MLVAHDPNEARRKQLKSHVVDANCRGILTSDCDGKFTGDGLGYSVSVPSSFPESYLKKIHDEGFKTFYWAGTTTENGRRATLFQFNLE
jgi:hypothetical protein